MPDLLTEVRHWRIWPPGKTNVLEAILLDEVKGGFRITLSRAKVEQPVISIRNLPSLANLLDCDGRGIEWDRVFACHRAGWCLPLGRQPIHHGLLARARGASDEADE